MKSIKTCTYLRQARYLVILNPREAIHIPGIISRSKNWQGVHFQCFRTIWGHFVTQNIETSFTVTSNKRRVRLRVKMRDLTYIVENRSKWWFFFWFTGPGVRVLPLIFTWCLIRTTLWGIVMIIFEVLSTQMLPNRFGNIKNRFLVKI